MVKRVFFSQHADNAFFIERLHELLDNNWPILNRAPEDRDITTLSKVFYAAVSNSIPDSVRAWERKGLMDVSRLAYTLLAYGVFGEAVRRWPETLLVEIQLIEQHAYTVDSQMRLYELTADRAKFFALLHVCLGDFCEQQQDPQQHELRAIKVHRTDRKLVFDVFAALSKNVEAAMSRGENDSERLRNTAKELFLSAEILLFNPQLFQ